jgi:hypothetical protein
MKRRWMSIAVAAVLADVFLVGTAWHLAPVLSLTVALAVPTVEPLLAPLYGEPVREDVAIDVDGGSLRAQLYRPVRAQRSLVLVRDTQGTDDGIAALARALARRGVVVVVPHRPRAESTSPSPPADAALRSPSPPADAAMLQAYAATFNMPGDVAAVSSFDEGQGPRSPLTRAMYAWRLFRLSRTLVN